MRSSRSPDRPRPRPDIAAVLVCGAVLGAAISGAAYPGRRFYYVLTHARGIRPPFGNALTVVAEVGEGGRVRPLKISDPAALGEGLIRVARADDARTAAAAVLVLTLGDPGERRWPVRPELVRVKKSRSGWLCTYAHGDGNHLSRVTFARNGVLTAVECNTPPVP